MSSSWRFLSQGRDHTTNGAVLHREHSSGFLQQLSKSVAFLSLSAAASCVLDIWCLEAPYSSVKPRGLRRARAKGLLNLNQLYILKGGTTALELFFPRGLVDLVHQRVDVPGRPMCPLGAGVGGVGDASRLFHSLRVGAGTEVEYPLLRACNSSGALTVAGLHTHVRTHRTSSDSAYLYVKFICTFREEEGCC